MNAAISKSARWLIAVIFSSLVTTCFATAEPPVIKVLDGSKGQLHVDSSVTVSDKFMDTSNYVYIDTPFYVKNIITFRINEDTNRYLASAFTATVAIRITYTLTDLSTIYIDTALTISYDPTHDSLYKARASFIFSGAHKVKVTIQSYSVSQSWATPSLILENEMDPWPNYKFSCTDKMIKSLTMTYPPGKDSDEVKVNWTNVIGADEYDLEWTYIDSAALASGKYGSPTNPTAELIFRNNASRITTTASKYNVPLIFPDAGTVFTRVRSVQIKSDGTKIVSNWSSDTLTGLGSYTFSGHQTNINWQATVSFAEEGKRKVVVQYYDGSLRGRETVTKDNDIDKTIVTETYYDFQGRPVIQVLPVPTLSSTIQYTANFNRLNTSHAEYTKGSYDTLVTCGYGAPAMDTAYGAGLYYSPLGDTSSIDKYIPNAHGYVFTQTDYTQDNTGRIARQGGVGQTFKIGGGHDTKYYYGSPDQGEIDALFGTEVGDASHYFKNMVQDANGQYSVSYVDMHGRTIATALAGDAPTGMDALSSYNKTVRTQVLADSNSNVTTGWTMQSKKSLLITRTDSLTFNYDLSPEYLQKEGCNNDTVCYDCLYDLEITITDDCNNQSFGGQPFIRTVHNFSIGHYDTANNAVDSPFHYQFGLKLQPGNYEVTKKLSISQQALNYYRDSIFTLKNTCRTAKDLIDSVASAQLHTGCEPDCQTCYATIGTIDSFRNHFVINTGISVADSASYHDQIISAYNSALAACQALCDSVTTDQDDILDAMLKDVSAPSGQYANIDAIDSFSVFYKPTLSSIPEYQDNTIVYKDAYGNADSVYDDSTGTFVIPQQLSQEEFAAKFRPSWANALLPFHPEYCKLQEYQNHHGSSHWDDQFLKVNTYSEANSLGYLNPTANTSSPFNQYTDVYANRDSLIIENTSAVNDSLKSLLENYIHHYTTMTVSGSPINVSMWTVASMTARCEGDSACATHFIVDSLGFDSLTCDGEQDAAWLTFRSIYQNVKRDIIDSLVRNASCTGINYTADQLFTAGHSPNFNNASTALNQNGLGYYLTGTPNDLQDSATKAMGEYYEDNCEAYANLWIQQLAPCNYDSVALHDTIIPRLIAVCRKGSDQDHPYGSRGISPDSTNTYQSFEDVINDYNQSHGITNVTACNADLINTPKPYNNQVVIGNKQILTKPSDCECERINELYYEYIKSPVTTDTSFSTYLWRQYHTEISDADLTQLRNMCNGTAGSCNYLTTPITLPPVLQCNSGNVCTTCEQMFQLYTKFQSEYDTVPHLVDPGDTSYSQVNLLFANFINNQLGYSKQPYEYIQFLKECSIASMDDSLQKIIVGFANDTLHRNYVPHYDSYGVDTTHWKIDLGGWVNNAGISISQCIRDGVLQFPQSYIDTAKTAQIDYYNDTLCLDSSGFTFEEKIKYPDGHTKPGDDVWQIWLYQNLDPGATYPDDAVIVSIKNAFPGVGICTDFNTPYYVCNPGTVSGFHMNDWTDIKLKFRGRKLTYYINDDSIIAQNLHHPFTTLSTWTNDPDSNYGQIDFIKIYDTLGNILYYEDFNDSSKVSNPSDLMQCFPDCETHFTNYYNQVRGTHYTYSQIDSIYVAITGNSPNACVLTESVLCGKSDPLFPQDTSKLITNCSDSTFFSTSIGTELYRIYEDSLKGSFQQDYVNKCMSAYKLESFTVSDTLSEYHYTLYYYDQAGNLVKTVPPQGVNAIRRDTWLDSVKTFRANKQSLVPQHTLITQYRYNTLNQVIAQATPDAGKSTFYYDRLGRLVLSQNLKQYSDNQKFSYTLYDNLGRIYQVGEIHSSATMDETISRDQSQLQTWLHNADTTRTQITATTYDSAYSPLDTILSAKNLRNRVAWTAIYNTGADLDSIIKYASATFYSYDIHGNVDTLVQDFKYGIMDTLQNRFKKIVYQYDLISGKVNFVAYQPNQPDAFYHRYSYDAQNRLTNVETSADSIHWENEAFYSYYLHGPLARRVIGQQQVQGVDYAYTLQGWLKGINSSVLSSSNDMGSDGQNNSVNRIGRDAIGYTIYYFGNSDYESIAKARKVFADTSNISADFKPLYNGNIAATGVNISSFSDQYLYTYTYDQLNRLTKMKSSSKSLNSSTSKWTAASLNNYKENISYDANGNILQYLRYYNNSSVMDSLNYFYYTNTNKLNRVKDTVADAKYSVDIDGQSTNNYVYDSIGNLTKDVKETIDSIYWNVYGKITQINKHDGTVIKYTYDAAGNRISKIVGTIQTWYVRDASGNIMSVYTKGDNTINSGALTQTEIDLYGSSRIGMMKSNINVQSIAYPPTKYLTGLNVYGYFINFIRGEKFFELNNHLGNVLTTISDKKIGTDANHDTIVNFYIPDVVSASDYYPFGMVMPGRDTTFGSSKAYRFGFNGKEMDNDTYGGHGNEYDYGFRIYNPRIGRFLSVDPLHKSFPWYTPYQFAGNKSINSIDFDGLEDKEVINWTTIGLDGTTTIKTTTINYEIGVGPLGKGTLTTYIVDQRQAVINPDYGKKGNTLSKVLNLPGPNDTYSFFEPSQDADKATRKRGGLWFVSKGGGGGSGPNGELEPGDGEPINIDLLISVLGGAGLMEKFEGGDKGLERVLHVLENIGHISEGGEKGVEIKELINEYLEKEKNKLPDPHTAYCRTCRQNFVIDENGNMTRDTSTLPAGDTADYHGAPLQSEQDGSNNTNNNTSKKKNE